MKMPKTPNIDPEDFERRWKNKYLGWQCLIVADGPSCPPSHVLERARCKVIGTNRAYKRTKKLDVYVMVDPYLTKEIGATLDQHVPGTELRMTAYPCTGSITPITTIRFFGPRGHRVLVVVYDVQGRLVQTLADDTFPAGFRSFTWSGFNDSGNPVGSGVYFYRLEAAGETFTRKMLLLK